MKKIICAVICLLALTACGGADNTTAAQNVSDTSAETETVSETEAETVHKDNDGNPPPAEQKGDVIRVTAVDGNVITGEKMWGGRGFGGGRPDGNAPSVDGEMPERGERPEGEPPAMPEDGSMPEKGDKNGERPQGEAVTFTITDSTAMDAETISEGDMIIAEINEDGTAASVKAAEMPKEPKETTTTT